MTAPAATARSGPPVLGLCAVLFGAFISTLNGRLSSFGLVDMRGALGLGVDEAAWINTAQAVAQVLIAPLALWAAVVLGPRRVLIAGAIVFATASALLPLCRSIEGLLALQFMGGLGSGCFMPLTIMYVLKNFAPRYWALGVALYALNIETSLNISASIEGFYIDHLSWVWIFWQNVPLALVMAVCVHFGIARQPYDRKAAGRADWFGMLCASLGLALIYAALDQGNRLDWLSSGLVNGLLLSGALLTLIFIVHEATTRYPLIDIRLVCKGYLPILLLLVCEVRFAALGTGLLVPQFLGAVRSFRPTEVGDVLVWVAVPQLVAVPLAAYVLRRIDPRYVVCVGIALIGAACWVTATSLTAQWSGHDFLLTESLQALGQTCAISGAIFFGVLNLRPVDIPTFGVMIQMARLLGGELGFAALTTFVRVSEQTSSQVLGAHVRAGSMDVLDRVQSMALQLAGRAESIGSSTARSIGLLAQAVRTQANLQACIDGFALVAASTIVAFLLLLLFDRPPRGPASPSWHRQPTRIIAQGGVKQ